MASIVRKHCVVPKCHPLDERRDVVLKCFVVKAGSVLFRGRTSANRPPTTEARWLAITQYDASIYGNVDVYTLNRDLHLLDMNDVETHAVMRVAYVAWAREHGKSEHSFDSVFERNKGTDVIIRTSEWIGDTNVLRSFCSQVGGTGCFSQFDGWMTLEMPTIARDSTHHPEVAMCNPSDEILQFRETLHVESESEKERVKLLHVCRNDAIQRSQRMQARKGRT